MSGLKSGIIMCEHEEILHCGEYVCIKCGIVLGQEYIYDEQTPDLSKKKEKNMELHVNICNILDKLNLSNFCYSDKIYELIDKYLSNFKSSSELKIGASIYYVLSLNNIPCQLNRINGLLCLNSSETKKLFKLIQVIPQANIISNDIISLADFLLCQSNFNKEDRKNIFKLLEKHSCRDCSYSPVTQIAGISYWYLKKCVKKKRSLKTICDSFFISQNSVHLYLNHYCTKKWTLE